MTDQVSKRLITQLERIYPPPRVTWPLLAESVTLGSKRRNTIVVRDPHVSRYHAKVQLVKGVWQIEDLESANGTQINRESITRPHQLRNSDRITVGKTWFRFSQEPVTGAPLPHHLGLLTAKEFEQLIAELLTAEGFTEVKVTGRSGDGGVDIAARCGRPFIEGRYSVQCKRYHGHRVTPPEVRAFCGAISGDGVKGAFVTTSGFTRGARKFAEDRGIATLNGLQLVDLLVHHRLWPFK